MPNRVKEEERIERIIRSLLKLPENKRCINCNSLGPQYVCTTFWTFVCTTCSGVHREFTHRVKSVSMAKFNAEEVDSLQAGGNERARQLYFKTWDQRNSLPDYSNLQRLRDFVQHVYVDRKYTGERSSDRLAMVKMGAKDGFYSSNGSRDEYYERGNSFERRTTRGRNEPRNLQELLEEKSPRYKENMRSGSNRSRSARFEIVDDRFRDDDYRGVRRFESRRISSAEQRAGSLSPDYPKSRKRITIPEVRPVKELLGNNVPRLRVGEPIKANDERDSDGALAQKTTPSTSPRSVNGKGVEKTVNSISLIDFNTEPELPDNNSASPQTQQTAAPSDRENSSVQSSPNPLTMNSVESLLFGLSAPADVPLGSTSEVPSTSGGDASSTTPVTLSNGANAIETAPTLGNNTLALPSNSGDSRSPSNASPKQSTARKELPADIFTALYSSCPAPVPDWQFRPPHGMGMGMQYHPTASPVPGFSNTAKSMNPFDVSDESAPVQTPMFPSMVSLQGALPHVSAHVGLQPQPSPYALALPPPPSYELTMSSGAYTGQQLPNNMLVSKPQRTSSSAFDSLNPLQHSSSRSQPPTAAPSYSSMGGNPFR